ncbi:MAG: cadherin-like beta sandwich domain-containing protein, partial [Nitrospirae bacterium]|nr:cadherin-like beta sandwich domain-containing protein [Nitrospirota bacterium]
MRTLTAVRQYLAAVFFLVIGLVAYGCGDSATVNPSVTITAQPAVAGDSVTINGQATTSSVIPLGAAGTTTPVNIVVSESGTNSRTYTILFVRAGLTGNNSLQDLTVSPGTLAPDFDENVQSYTIDVANNIGSVTVTPTLSDPAATMTVNGQVTNSGQTRTISLSPAGQSTTITIEVTAQNRTKKPYAVSVSRGISNNNSLRSLGISPGSLSPAFSAGRVGYTVNLPSTLPSNIANVTVTPTLQDTTASMAVNGQPTTSGQSRATPLPAPGSNAFINIVVTAQNGSQKTYTVNVIRAALGGNNNLSALTVSPGPLTPAFTAATTSYTVDVASTVTSITVTPTRQDSNATITVTPPGTGSGQARTILLNGAGSNTLINILVTAPNGSQKNYTVNVSRAALGGNNNLSALTVSPGPLTPAFAAATTSYTVDVTSTVTSINVSATKADPNAVMSGSLTAGAGTASAQTSIQLGGPGTTRVVSITVTAPNGSSKTYTITVER